MIRTVIVGFAHMHVNEIAMYIDEQPDMELCAIADVPGSCEKIPPFRYTPEWNLENVKKKYCGNVYGDYKKMLDEVKPELAFVLTENSQKVEVCREIARRKINISIEKPLAASLSEAKEIADIVKENDVEAVVNWPVVWRSHNRFFKSLAESKIVGEPIKLRYINGHTGPLGKGAKHRGVDDAADEMSDEQKGRTWWYQSRYGGGIYPDISCYGCFFANWIFGNSAKNAMSYGANLNTPFADTDDNFAAAIEYDGRMAVLEGTWTTPRALIPSGPMLICTDGVIMCTGGAEENPGVKVFDVYGNEIKTEMPELEDKYQNMAWHYSHCKKFGEPFDSAVTIEENLNMISLMDAMIKSSKSGKKEPVNYF